MVVPTWATIRPVAAPLQRFANPAVVCEGWYAVGPARRSVPVTAAASGSARAT